MDLIKNAGRIVVKIGTSSLTYENGKLNFHRIETLSRVISDLSNMGKEIILVSSGAVTAGRAKLNFGHKPASTEEKQALAAVGQAELMKIYERFFGSYGHNVAQILITREIVDNAICKQNVQNTFNMLLSLGCIPIVNENDTTSFEEIEFGDNDTLAAYVAVICHADALINLSDIDGLYNKDPHKHSDAELIRQVDVVDETIRGYAEGAGSDFGTGGVITKLNAAEISTAAGIPMILTNGEDPEILYRLESGCLSGTLFSACRKA